MEHQSVPRTIARHSRSALCSDADSRAAPVVVALHRAHSVSGVRVAGARLARLENPHYPWRPLVVGAEITEDRLRGTALLGAPGLNVVSWPKDADPVTQVLMVRDALRDMGATVVVPNDLPHGFIGAALDAHRGVGCLGFCHGNDLLNLDLYRRCLPLADAVCAVNRDILETASRYVPPGCGKGVVVCGLHVPREPVQLSTPLPPSRPIRLLYAGWLDNVNKRAMDLAVLADALEGLGVAFELTIAGDGPVRERLQHRLTRHAAEGRVRLPGGVAPDAMDALYRASDLLVLVSRAEGAPLVVMEAMAQGRGVALTAGCGGALEAVRDGVDGVVVGVGDMAGLARRIAALARDGRGLEVMGRAAHAAALRHFDLGTLAARYDAMVRAAQGSKVESGAAHGRAGVERRWRRILGALEMLGPCDPSRLARVWAADLGVPEAWVQPRVLPGLLGPADELVLGAVALLETRGCLRIALYGAGRHTRRVERGVRRTRAIVAIADDKAGEPGGPGTELLGLPVVKPSGLKDLGVDGVIISSDEHEEAMLTRARQWSGTMPVVGLYER